MLAQRMKPLAARGEEQSLLVLGLPRGGVPVAAQVAKELHAPIDVFMVRKLGFPGQEELALGALASGGLRVLNQDLIDRSDLTEEEIEAETRRETDELQSRERVYREGRPRPSVEGRTVILVDDGLATGASLRAGIRALRQARPRRIIAAVPVASREGYQAVAREADDIVALMVPEDFQAVGRWYADFHQVSDSEVKAGLAEAET